MNLVEFYANAVEQCYLLYIMFSGASKSWMEHNLVGYLMGGGTNNYLQINKCSRGLILLSLSEVWWTRNWHPLLLPLVKNPPTNQKYKTQFLLHCRG